MCIWKEHGDADSMFAFCFSSILGETLQRRVLRLRLHGMEHWCDACLKRFQWKKAILVTVC
jgi:hypothetical protein